MIILNYSNSPSLRLRDHESVLSLTYTIEFFLHIITIFCFLPNNTPARNTTIATFIAALFPFFFYIRYRERGVDRVSITSPVLSSCMSVKIFV